VVVVVSVVVVVVVVGLVVAVVVAVVVVVASSSSSLPGVAATNPMASAITATTRIARRALVVELIPPGEPGDPGGRGLAGSPMRLVGSSCIAGGV
jgi:hypothetical protein